MSKTIRNTKATRKGMKSDKTDLTVQIDNY